MPNNPKAMHPNWLRATEDSRLKLELGTAKKKIETLEKRNAELRSKLDNIEKVAFEYGMMPPPTVLEIQDRLVLGTSVVRRIRNLANALAR